MFARLGRAIAFALFAPLVAVLLATPIALLVDAMQAGEYSDTADAGMVINIFAGMTEANITLLLGIGIIIALFVGAVLESDVRGNA